MNGFLQLKENRIEIDGVKGDHAFIHISDTHAIYSDDLSTPDEIAKAIAQEKAWDDVKRDFARHFGEPFNDEHDIPSYRALTNLLSFAKSEKPELLLLSGDIIDYLSPAAITFMKNCLDDYGGGYLFASGNHEGSLAANRALLQFSGNSDDVAVYNGDGFIIAALDNSNKDISNKQMSTLCRLLYGSTPVILLMHIPIATEYNAADMAKFGEYFVIDTDSPHENARRLLNMLCDSQSMARAILCGHVHGYHRSYFFPDRPQICASSGLVGFAHRFIVSGRNNG